MKALRDKDWARATLEVEDAAAKHPGLMPAHVVERLKIDPATLRAMHEEERRRLEPEERDIRLQDEQKLLPFLGKMLSSLGHDY